MENLFDFFTKERMAKLSSLDINVGKKLSSGFIGKRKSGQNGGSLEFSDFREYAFGDDDRRIDWNAYARTENLFVKLFTEEKRRDVNIVLDTSASMDYMNKGFYAKALAASLAYICLKNADRVNVFAFNENVTQKITGVSSVGRFYEIVEFINDLRFNGQTDIDFSMEQALKLFMKKSAAYIISDFYSDNIKKTLRLLAYNKICSFAVRPYAPEEENPSLNGAFRLIDGENNQTSDIIISPRVIAAYKKEYAAAENKLKELCLKTGTFYAALSTDAPVIKNILTIL